MKTLLVQCLLLSMLLFSCSEQEDISITLSDEKPLVLVDASKDGGGWWSPQHPGTGFSESEPHQGKPLADYLRSIGFEVDELPRGIEITTSLLEKYDRIIRATAFRPPNTNAYTSSELAAYAAFLDRPNTSLLLISEHKNTSINDELCESLGISFTGSVRGSLENFSSHPITQGATPFYYNAGSVIANASENPSMSILGWVKESPVMGVLSHPNTKIFFLGDINGIEEVPQPFVENLIDWAFE